MTLTHARALGAFYVDFEGTRDASPALVGVLHEERYEATLLDDRLAPAARALGLPLRPLGEWVERLVRSAARIDAAIVAYSPHEEDVVARYAPGWATDFAARAVNAQPLVRSWMRSHGVSVPRGTRGLKAFAALHGMPYPEGLMAESVPKRLGAILAACLRHPDWDEAPRAARQRLTDLLDYNELDCVTLRRLTLGVARGSEPLRRTVRP